MTSRPHSLFGHIDTFLVYLKRRSRNWDGQFKSLNFDQCNSICKDACDHLKLLRSSLLSKTPPPRMRNLSQLPGCFSFWLLFCFCCCLYLLFQQGSQATRLNVGISARVRRHVIGMPIIYERNFCKTPPDFYCTLLSVDINTEVPHKNILSVICFKLSCTKRSQFDNLQPLITDGTSLHKRKTETSDFALVTITGSSWVGQPQYGRTTALKGYSVLPAGG